MSLQYRTRLIRTLRSGLLLVAFGLFGQSAQAQIFTLAPINNNNCEPIRNEISLLNSPGATVQAVCSDRHPGGFPSNNGKFYDYRLATNVHVPGGLAVGASIQLGDIFTNNCERARALISMLSSQDAVIQPVCSAYIPGGYSSGNGRRFDYRLSTFLTRRR